MNRGARQIITIAALASVALLSGSAILLFRHITRAGSSESFAVLLEQIDADVARGYLSKAEDAIGRSLDSVHGEYNLLRLLKRAYGIAALSGDYTRFFDTAYRALRKIPGSRSIARIALYASLRADEEVTPGKIPKDIEGQYLMAEAVMRHRLKGEAKIEWAPEVRELLTMRLPVSADQLQGIGSRRSDARIMLDAALIWMKMGNPQKALAALNSTKAESRLWEPLVMISYDAGELPQAAALLAEQSEPGERPDLLLIRADLARLLEHEIEAANLYQRAIARDASFYWSPYLNLADILAAQGQDIAAEELLLKVYSLFPEAEAVTVEYAKNRVRRGDRASALAALKRLIAERPSNVSARLVLLELERGSQSPQRYQGMLWQLFSEHPDSAILCQALVFHLLGYGDLDGATAALRQFAAEAGEQKPSWLLELQGLLAALHGRLAEAAALLAECLQREQNWRIRNNLAVVLSSNSKRGEAIEQLLAAVNELEPLNLPGFHSRVRAMLARLLAETGNFSAARRESLYALELDRTNSQALLLLRMLEGK